MTHKEHSDKSDYLQGVAKIRAGEGIHECSVFMATLGLFYFLVEIKSPSAPESKSQHQSRHSQRESRRRYSSGSRRFAQRHRKGEIALAKMRKMAPKIPSMQCCPYRARVLA